MKLPAILILHSTEYLIYLTQQFLQTHSRWAFLQLLKLERLQCLMMPIKQLIGLTLSIRARGIWAKPEVFIRFPAYTSGYLGDLESGVAYVDSNLTGGTIASVQLSDVGSGYFYPPEVEIEGGAHFVRLVDEDSNYSGKFYRITSNSGNSLTLENDLYEDLQIVFEDDSEVEIFESWTLGELFGYETSPFNVTENNGSVTYDFIHLLKPSSNQSGTNDDYTAYFHKDGAWRKVDDENYIANHEVISPDASLIVSRRSALDLDLNLSGIALSIQPIWNSQLGSVKRT